MSAPARKKRDALPPRPGFTLYLQQKTPGLCTCTPRRFSTPNGIRWAVHTSWCALPIDQHEEQLR
jgi:hypothetical protein